TSSQKRERFSSWRPSRRRNAPSSVSATAADAITTRTFSSADQSEGRRPSGCDRFAFAFFLDTSSTVAASRNHRDRVGCVMPTSCASALADSPFGPVILSTIRARKPSLYSVISQAYAPPGSRLAEAASILTQGASSKDRDRSVRDSRGGSVRSGYRGIGPGQARSE